jgi:hypothetical protein
VAEAVVVDLHVPAEHVLCTELLLDTRHGMMLLL